MHRYANLYSFYISILSLFLFSFVLYNAWSQQYIITSFLSWILLLILAVIFILALTGIKSKATKFSRSRSRITIGIASMLLIIWLFLQFLSYIGGKELLQTVESPNQEYTVHFYSWDAGAAGTFGIVGEIDGVWFDKRFYRERHAEVLEVEWINDRTISINNHQLDLEMEEIYSN